MLIPEDLRYSAEHEWVRVADGIATVGITDFAQEHLGDVVYVELPEVGSSIAASDTVCEIESTKSVSEIYAPVSGTVHAVNQRLTEQPELVNQDPYGDGWIMQVALAEASGLDALLDAAGYRALVE